MKMRILAVALVAVSFITLGKAGGPYSDQAISDCNNAMDAVGSDNKMGNIFNKFLAAIAKLSQKDVDLLVLLQSIITTENSSAATETNIPGVTVSIPNNIARRFFYEGLRIFISSLGKFSKPGVTRFYKSGGGKGAVAQVVLILQTLHEATLLGPGQELTVRHLYVFPNKDGSLPGNETYFQRGEQDAKSKDIDAAHVALDNYMTQNEVIKAAMNNNKIQIHYVLGKKYMESIIKEIDTLGDPVFKTAVQYFEKRGTAAFQKTDDAAYRNAITIAEKQIREAENTTKALTIAVTVDGVNVIGPRFNTEYPSAFSALALAAMNGVYRETAQSCLDIVAIDKPTGIDANGKPINWKVYPSSDITAATTLQYTAIFEVLQHKSNEDYKTGVGNSQLQIYTVDQQSFFSAIPGFQVSTYLK